MKKETDTTSTHYLPRSRNEDATSSDLPRARQLQRAQHTQQPSRIRGWFRGIFGDTFWGIRTETERARAHTEYFHAAAEAVEAMHDLEVTPEQVVDKYNRNKVQTARDHELALAQKKYEIEKITQATNRLAAEDAVERARLHAALADINKKNAPPPPKEAGDAEQLDPDARKAREVMDKLRRRARMEDELERFRKEQFAAIDAEVENGTLTPEEAKKRKERLQEQINFELQEP